VSREVGRSTRRETPVFATVGVGRPSTHDIGLMTLRLPLVVAVGSVDLWGCGSDDETVRTVTPSVVGDPLPTAAESDEEVRGQVQAEIVIADFEFVGDQDVPVGWTGGRDQYRRGVARLDCRRFVVRLGHAHTREIRTNSPSTCRARSNTTAEANIVGALIMHPNPGNRGYHHNGQDDHDGDNANRYQCWYGNCSY